MNKLVITESILNEIYDDNSFKESISELINSLIDSELQKDEPDFDFIDECADALIEVQSGNYSEVMPFIANHKFEDKEKKRKVLSLFLACAVVFTLSIGAVAVSHTVEKKRESQTTTKQPETTTAATTLKEVTTTSAPSTTAALTTTKIPSGIYAVNLELSYSDNFKETYSRGEKLDLDGLIVTVDFSDGSRRRIDVSDCKVIKNDDFGNNRFAEKVTIEYQGSSKSFFVTFPNNVSAIKPIDPEEHTYFDTAVYPYKIESSTQYVEIEPGESVRVAMRKNNNGFVCFTTDNDLLEDVSIAYLGGVNGREIYLDVTAGSTPGVTKISLAYERDRDDTMTEITVRVVERSDG